MVFKSHLEYEPVGPAGTGPHPWVIQQGHVFRFSQDQNKYVSAWWINPATGETIKGSSVEHQRFVDSLARDYPFDKDWLK